MATLVQGSIVWARVPEPQGRNPKDRPLVVLTERPKDLADEDELVVVAVSTQSHEAPAEHRVELPWSRQPGCVTKLTGPSAAVCSWLCKIKKCDVRKIGGLVPPKFLQQILAKIVDLRKAAAPDQDEPAS